MARSKVYLRSQSGRTEDFDQFRQRLRKLGTSETMRFREVRKLLLKEAQPLVTEARNQAYADSQEPRGIRLKSRSALGAKFYNLYGSINKWANKGTTKAYVVIGLRGSRKQGAYYAPWQLFGGAEKNFKPKDFIGLAVDNTNVVQKAQKMMQKHIQKRITSVLR
jgi:hypothetical protein